VSERLEDQVHPNLNGAYIDKVEIMENRKAMIGVRFRREYANETRDVGNPK
jgi:hypothetical protein